MRRTDATLKLITPMTPVRRRKVGGRRSVKHELDANRHSVAPDHLAAPLRAAVRRRQQHKAIREFPVLVEHETPARLRHIEQGAGARRFLSVHQDFRGIAEWLAPMFSLLNTTARISRHRLGWKCLIGGR